MNRSSNYCSLLRWPKRGRFAQKAFVLPISVVAIAMTQMSTLIELLPRGHQANAVAPAC